MSNKILTQEIHTVPLLDPVANAFAGTVNTAPVSVKEAHAITFFYWKAVGATGTATITVQACDTTVPGNTQAIIFRYRTMTGGTTPQDVWSSGFTLATTAGFTTTAGSSQMYAIEVDVDNVVNAGAAGKQWGYVRLVSVEQTASAVLGGIWAQLRMRKARQLQATQLT